MEKCGNCKFWKQSPKDDPEDDCEPFEIGSCKRYPPINDMMMIMREIKEWPENGYVYPGQYSGSTHKSMRPKTLMADWCGEFKSNDRT